MARKQWAVNSRRVVPLCRAMLRQGGKGRETGQRRNRTPVRRGLGTHVLPAGLVPPRSCCRWGPRVRRCLGFPRRGREDAMLGASPVLCLFGGCGGKRRRRPGLGWEAPDTVPRTVGNRLFRELVTPPCPPPLSAAGGEPGQLREQQDARAQHQGKGKAGSEEEEEGEGRKAGGPCLLPPPTPGEGVRCNLALGPRAGL